MFHISKIMNLLCIFGQCPSNNRSIKSLEGFNLYLNLQSENSRRRSSRKFFKAGGGGGLRSKRSLIREAPSEYESTSAVSSVIVNTP